VHGVDQVVEKRLEARLADFHQRDGRGRAAQGGVTEPDDRKDGHVDVLLVSDRRVYRERGQVRFG
jgi:hypothetical protein